MQLLNQSTVETAYVGPVLDSAGAPVTTAVLGDFRLVKNGTAATLTGATVTHDANGYYRIAFTTGNTDTIGRLDVGVGNTAMSMANHRFMVVSSVNFSAMVTNNLPDAILTRNVSNVESTAGEHTLCTVVLAMLEHSISGSTLTIKRTDGSTTHVTKTLTSDSGAAPITGIQ